MSLSEVVDYESDGNGFFWVPDNERLKCPFAHYENKFFLPEGHINIFDLIDLFGENLFPDDWTKIDKYSFPTVASTHPSYNNELVLAGFHHWGERVRINDDGEEIAEALMLPLSEKEHAAKRASFMRMNKVLKTVRQKLYSGEVQATTNPEHPSQTDKTSWAGELWDIIVYKKFSLQYIHDKYGGTPKIYFSKGHIVELLGANIHASNLDTEAIPKLVLSPYIRFALEVTQEFEITEPCFPKKDVVIQYVSENWKADCGTKTDNKVKMVATMVRWPAHESGGNRKARVTKG